MLRSKVLVSAVMTTLLAGSMGAANAIPYRDVVRDLPRSLGNVAQVSVMDRDSGRALPVYRHRGEYWVAGTPGAKYSVAVTNQQGARIMAVMSVDGINVLTGATADVMQSGYVFSSGQRYEVAGWRKSNQEIAAFEFVASPRSYAERTGRPMDVGVIGVALFNERVVPPVWHHSSPDRYEYDRYNGANDSNRYKRGESSPSPLASPAPSAPPAAPAPGAANEAQKRYSGAEASAQARAEPKLGTGHGAREWSTVTQTSFERATNQPVEVIRIRYDSRENLIAMGVIREPFFGYPRRTPNAFPDSVTHHGYVPDPPRW
ncbi:MAG: hypothetical protein EAZ43_06895 [Betaproteobacteria bacterium]|nr:MAG: hypothetical protein EAZ43_06895 [Betaproteobacteria bacterium]